MGSDKGLIAIDSGTWALEAVQKLKNLDLQVVLSVNQTQLHAYAALFPDHRLIADDLSLGIKGPLAGVLSVHNCHPEEDIFVLACDMPFMEEGLLREIYTCYLSLPEPGAFVFSINGDAEPLCAIYRSVGLIQVISTHRHAKLTKHSMKSVLEQLIVSSLIVPEEKKSCFRNINSRNDLNNLQPE